MTVLEPSSFIIMATGVYLLERLVQLGLSGPQIQVTFILCAVSWYETSAGA